MEFSNRERQLQLGFYFVADIECILQKESTCQPNPAASNTTRLNKHIPCGVAYKINCSDPRFYRNPVIITREVDGKSIIEQFLDSILQDAKEIREIYRYISPMLPLTVEEQIAYDSPNAMCHICEKRINANEIKCRDHNHLTGEFNGPSHQACNLNYKIDPNKIQIPCFFHNLKNYDAHFLIKEAKPRHGEIKIIPTTTEKYISFTIGDIVFKDSYAFTQASLESLAENLESNQFINTRRWLEHMAVQNCDDSSEEEEEEEPDEDDMMFIDDRKHRYSFMDEDDNEDYDGEVSSEEDEYDMMTSDDNNDYEGEISEENEEIYSDEQMNVEIDPKMAEYDYRRSPYQNPILTNEQKQQVEEDLALLRNKGIYPYEYFDSFERFEERTLPPIEAFKSQLHAGAGITEEEYRHAKNVFEHFQMETLQDYHNLYLLQDIFLLDDILAAFQAVCLKTYGLDPLHYHTAPGLTWDAGLKYTGVTLDLITDEEIFMFIEAGIRGGISVISHRYAKVNHPNHENIGLYNPNEPNKQMLYLDANNLYGHAMMQYLPISDFEMIPTMSEEELHSIKPDSEYGYIWKIDCMIPRENHDKFANYPIAPEGKQVHYDMLSDYQKNILREQYIMDNQRTESMVEDEIKTYCMHKKIDYNALTEVSKKALWELFSAKYKLTEEMIEEKIQSYKSTEKLILDLEPKHNYIVHYRTLQLYLQLGMKITHIHSILKFKQKPWLASYIQANTEMRQKATNEFEKSFFKLMNNAFFGKTMENVRKRRNITLVNSPEKLRKLVAQPTFQSTTAFHEELSAVERMKTKVVMNKPIYIGLCVLELSKWLMYNFYYNILNNIFSPDKIHLLFTDTDSLCVSIEGYNNIYHTIRESYIGQEPAINFFDLSAYPSNHCIFTGLENSEIKRLQQVNKKVPGKMKDELNGEALLEFVGLRAKSYAFRKQEKNEIKEEKKLKGIQKCVVKTTINFEHYKTALMKRKTHIASTCSLRSHLHEIRTLAINKVATGPYDDKRYLRNDGISSVPYGHYSIQQ